MPIPQQHLQQQPGVQQNLQQQPYSQQQQQTQAPTANEETPNRIFNEHQYYMLRTQIHTYKLIIRNEPVPQKMFDMLKTKPSVTGQPMNGMPQTQQQQAIQMNPQQIRMRK